MHEMALAEGVLAVVLEVAEGEPVRRIQLRVGRLQAVVPESLQLCFQLAAEDTVAAQAKLELNDVPACLRCYRCGRESQLEAPPFNCHHCGASEIEIVAGDELLVDGVELDSGWRYRPGAEGSAAALADAAASHVAEHAREAAGRPNDARPA
jgi:hydrogenase nickel incorporation protein HypA/HybF